MLCSRRNFLKASLSLPALLGEGSVFESPARHSTYDPWIEIRADHLKQNIAEIHRRIQGRPILAVIKNNGYGLGLVNVATILEPLPPVAGFAVIKLQEAITLRDANIRKPILLMGPLSESELEEALARDIMPMVYAPLGTVLDRLAKKFQRPIPLHCCVDTGIGRVGIPSKDALPLLTDLAGRSSVHLAGTMMTFTEDVDFDREQLKRFLDLCRKLESGGFRLGKKHAASSFALFQNRDSFLDMVRPGMGIFGIYPEQKFRTTDVMELKPAVALKANVIYVKMLKKGESAGYNRVFMAQQDTYVATLPVGHADGLPRSVTSGARVRIKGFLYPIVAISASHIIIELGSRLEVQAGDEAIVFDWQNGSRPEDVAAASNSSVYDLTMHLNPLLPRRVI